MALITGLYL